MRSINEILENHENLWKSLMEMDSTDAAEASDRKTKNAIQEHMHLYIGAARYIIMLKLELKREGIKI